MHDSRRRANPHRTAQENVSPHRARPHAANVAFEAAMTNLLNAAYAWADRDYGESGEIEADAALNDAVRELRRVAGHDSAALLARLRKPLS
jgi:hypothetical protein